jgi:hypothetical protein
MLSRRRLLALPATAAIPLMAKETEPLDLPEDFEADKNDTQAGLLRLSANRKYSKALLSIRADYRARLADIIGSANRITVHLLDFKMDGKPESEDDATHFFISPYQRYASILQTRELPEKERAAGVSHLQRLLRTRGDEGWSAFCHYPIHAVRVYLDDDLLFRSSFCWECTNYFVQYPDDADSSATWVGLKDQALEDFFKAQMPIPQAEIDRFKRTIKGE